MLNVFQLVVKCVYLLMLIYMNVEGNVQSGRSMLSEYCSSEIFNPSCKDNEVIILEHALYGLMKLGRCVTLDFGHLGCSSNQLAFLDTRCSGRKQCEVRVPEKEMDEDLPCPLELRPYLEAQYKCQAVLEFKGTNCGNTVSVPVRSASIYLSSEVSRLTGCGTGSAAFLLESHPGQSINLTLIDFSWTNSKSLSSNSDCLFRYGHVYNFANDDVADVCGGGRVRVKHIYQSKGNKIQIILDESALVLHRYLIKFEAIGCSDMVPPKNTWLKKDGNDVTIGCHTTGSTWRLRCIGNHWIGVKGNCSEAQKVVEPEPKKEHSFTTDHVAVIGICSLALVICCLTVTIGIYFIRRYKVKLRYKTASSEYYLVPTATMSGTMTARDTLSGRQTQSLRTVNYNTQDRTNNHTLGGHTMDIPSTLLISSRNQQLHNQVLPGLENTHDSTPQYYVLEPPGYMS